MSARRQFSHNRKPREPMMVSVVRTTTMIESVVAAPICSVL